MILLFLKGVEYGFFRESLIYQNLSNREKAIILWIILILIYTQYTDRYFYKTILGILKIVYFGVVLVFIYIY